MKPQPIDPTPEEIAAECAKIQAEWSKSPKADGKSFVGVDGPAIREVSLDKIIGREVLKGE